MQGPIYSHSRLSVLSASSQSSVDLGTGSSTLSARTPNTRPRPASALGPVNKRNTAIYDRNLNKTRMNEVGMSSWAFLFGEMVQYTQKRVSGIGDLERRSENATPHIQPPWRTNPVGGSDAD